MEDPTLEQLDMPLRKVRPTESPHRSRLPAGISAVGRSHAGAGAEHEVEGAAETDLYKLTPYSFPIPLQHLQREEVE